MANIHIATDNIGSYSHDINNLNKVIEILRAAGHTVTGAGRGDNAIQGHMLSSSHKCDIMMQIAGGQCPGTFIDFHLGTKGGKNTGYYYADKYCIPIETSIWTNYAHYNPKTYKLPASAWDDGFSRGLDKSKTVNRTWQQICQDKENFPRCIGFVEGNGGEEVGNNLVKLLNGGSSTGTDAANATQNASGSILDYIKQVCSDLDPYGVELEMNGETVSIHKSRLNTAVPLGPDRIVNNSMSYVDYDSNTPNSNGKVKDKYLIDRFGEVPLEAEIEGDEAQVLQIAQRDGGHSIDLKCLLSKDYQAGKWVKLSIPEMGITDRYYYITRSSHDEELTSTVSLNRGPPSLHVDIQEIAEETTEEAETTEETTEEE